MPATSRNRRKAGRSEPAGKRSLVRRWRDFVRVHPLAAALAAASIGAVAGVPATDGVDLYFSSERFCAHTCHVMEATVYEEYRDSTHGKTPSGVRPTCSDCHISRRITKAMWGHLLGTREFFVWLANDFSDAAAFEDFRPEAAERVRMGMLRNDSYTCRQCHVMALIRPEKRRGKKMHDKAKEEGTTCIACHYNLVHKEVEPSEAFLEASDRFLFKRGESVTAPPKEAGPEEGEEGGDPAAG